jgi:hypothetical protein
MLFKNRYFILFFLVFFYRVQAHARFFEENANILQIKPVLELGSLQVFQNIARWGQNGTRFNYAKDGGQNLLTFFQRYTTELAFLKHHSFILLYQPFTFNNRVITQQALRFANVAFPLGVAMDAYYGFDFFRLTYEYQFFPLNRYDLALGGALQIRNAKLYFSSVDGQYFFNQSNIGVVPLIHIRGFYHFDNCLFVGSEIAGMYAPIPGINGSLDKDVSGSIIDLSLRMGMHISSQVDSFINIRYFAGGAKGESTNLLEIYKEPTPTDSFFFLQALSVSLGWSIST